MTVANRREIGGNGSAAVPSECGIDRRAVS